MVSSLFRSSLSLPSSIEWGGRPGVRIFSLTTLFQDWRGNMENLIGVESTEWGLVVTSTNPPNSFSIQPSKSMHCRQLGLPLCVWGCVCSLCGGMTDRGKQILWGGRVNASALARRLSQNLFPLAAAGRSQTEEEHGREWRTGGRWKRSSVSFRISLVWLKELPTKMLS